MKEKDLGSQNNYQDFFDEWTQVFIDKGFDEGYIKDNMSKYQEFIHNKEVWPEGPEFAINLLKLRFVDIIDERS